MFKIEILAIVYTLGYEKFTPSLRLFGKDTDTLFEPGRGTKIVVKFSHLVSVVTTVMCLSVGCDSSTSAPGKKEAHTLRSEPKEKVKPVVPQVSTCSLAINQFGHPVSCECDDPLLYDAETGLCQSAKAEDPGLGGVNENACVTHSDCSLVTRDCNLEAVHNDVLTQVVSENLMACESDAVEPDWYESKSVEDALCENKRCEVASRSWKSATNVSAALIRVESDSQWFVEASAIVGYCSHKPALGVRIDRESCALIVEIAANPLDICDALKEAVVAFSSLKFHAAGQCSLQEVTLPQAPEKLTKEPL